MDSRRWWGDDSRPELGAGDSAHRASPLRSASRNANKLQATTSKLEKPEGDKILSNDRNLDTRGGRNDKDE